jgi:hypothetical protein
MQTMGRQALFLMSSSRDAEAGKTRSTFGSIFMAKGIPVTTTARPARSAKSRPSLTYRDVYTDLLLKVFTQMAR